MKLLKTTMIMATLMAVPTLALAQISVGSLTGAAKSKAAETVLENATGGDALNAGTTLLKGGSREDAALAVVKGRADKRIDNLTGGVSTNDLSNGGLLDSGKSIVSNRLGRSETTNVIPKSSSKGVLGQASGVIGSSSKTSLPNLGDINF